MKVINISSDRMIIRTKPVLLWILGIIFGFVGLFLIAFLGRETVFSCQRWESNSNGSCEHIESSLIGSSSKTIKINDLKGARVEEYNDSDGDDTYKVIIETEQRDIPFTFSSSSGYSEKKEVVDKINSFIYNKTQKDLIVKEDDRFIIGIIGGIFAFVGIICVVLVCQISIYIDKSIKKIRIIKQNLIRKYYLEFNFDEIKDIYVNESSDSDGSTYRVEFKTSTGEIVPLTSYYTSGYEDKYNLVRQIKDFIH